MIRSALLLGPLLWAGLLGGEITLGSLAGQEPNREPETREPAKPAQPEQSRSEARQQEEKGQPPPSNPEQEMRARRRQQAEMQRRAAALRERVLRREEPAEGEDEEEAPEAVIEARENVELARARLELARVKLEVAEQRRVMLREARGNGGDERARREMEAQDQQLNVALEQARDRLNRMTREIQREDDPNLRRAREELEAVERRIAAVRSSRERAPAAGPENDPQRPIRPLLAGEAEVAFAEARVGVLEAEIGLARAERALARAEDADAEQADEEDEDQEMELEIDLEDLPPTVKKVLRLLQEILREAGDEVEQELDKPAHSPDTEEHGSRKQDPAL